MVGWSWVVRCSGRAILGMVAPAPRRKSVRTVEFTVWLPPWVRSRRGRSPHMATQEVRVSVEHQGGRGGRLLRAGDGHLN